MPDDLKKIKDGESKGRTFKVACAGTCVGVTTHVVSQSVDVFDSEVVFVREDERYNETIDWIDRYQVIQCQGCEAFSFRHVNWFSENQDHDDDGTTVRLYPKRGGGMLTAQDFHDVPRNLRGIYKEIVSCFNNESPILCAAGLRAAIEGLCAEQGVTGGSVIRTNPDGTTYTKRTNDLEGKISGLAEKSVLTKRNANILHSHRFLGNDAVHALSRPSDEELTLAIEIVEHMFKDLYEIPEKADVLQASRLRRKTP